MATAAFVLMVLGKGVRTTPPQQAPVVPGGDQTDIYAELTFAYEAAARFNETVIGNIDAVDNSMAAILAASVAIAIFVIENVVNAASIEARAATALLAASIACCAIGYLSGFVGQSRNRDGVRPRALVADLTSRRSESILGAVQALIAASEGNIGIRRHKRIFAGLAVAFLVAAVVLIAVARSEGSMIH